MQEKKGKDQVFGLKPVSETKKEFDKGIEPFIPKNVINNFRKAL